MYAMCNNYSVTNDRGIAGARWHAIKHHKDRRVGGLRLLRQKSLSTVPLTFDQKIIREPFN